ncbi:hypothetical protein BDN72DRAFT_964070 [Pluteus cervinus]|uniref:Uncharacterized protein n=1 Tax=Pluteus cervinus TaxID=181527 RepID=A0ACD3AEB5_9AGAR|nr:hypothetical protein BDN72DRAFT_964070 [Pluteus cervinus]
MPDPIFPPEIEYIVFTNALALKNHGESALNLISVAKRVHAWLIPRLIQTLVVRTDPGTYQYPMPWKIAGIRKYGKYVRNLFLWTARDHIEGVDAETYLILCPNVTNLLLWNDGDVDEAPFQEIVHLPLTHLSIDLTAVPEITSELSQLFSRLTHFETVGNINSENDVIQLKHLTSITHLAVPEMSIQRTISTVFTKLPTLQVLVLVQPGNRRTRLGLGGSFDPKSDDPRIVRVGWQYDKEVEDWMLDIEGQGMWGLADKEVRERQIMMNRKGI